jgi:hypothetical protein
MYICVYIKSAGEDPDYSLDYEFDNFIDMVRIYIHYLYIHIFICIHFCMCIHMLCLYIYTYAYIIIWTLVVFDLS